MGAVVYLFTLIQPYKVVFMMSQQPTQSQADETAHYSNLVVHRLLALEGLTQDNVSISMSTAITKESKDENGVRA